VVTVVVEISGRASPQALREKKEEEGVARVWAQGTCRALA
jgi:hypothetical protein